MNEELPPAGGIAPDLLAILACPRCHGGLTSEPASLRCDRCRLRFAILDGIPDMLLDDATGLDDTASS